MHAIAADHIKLIRQTGLVHPTVVHMHQTAHLLSPLDKDLVKALLRCLRSTSFQGSAYLLAALANTGTGDVRRTEGLLKVRWISPAPTGLDCWHIVVQSSKLGSMQLGQYGGSEQQQQQTCNCWGPLLPAGHVVN